MPRMIESDSRPEIQIQGDVAPHCRLQGVTKSFGGIAAVKDIDFDVRSGEVHALVGENGAGKSTLMKIIAGVHRPDSGVVELGGEVVELNSPRAAELAGIALVPQELELFPEMTVAENLMIGRSHKRTAWGTFDRSAMRREARELLERLDVDIDVELQVKRLSAASRQIVVIARALAQNARVVIMDEPTAALSDNEARHLFGIVEDLKARNVGVVYISHRLDEVLHLADRITVMRDGRRVASTTPAEVTQDELVRLMVGRPLSQFYSRRRSPAGDVLLETRGLAGRNGFGDVNLRLHAGEVVGVWGLIGAGRTELAQAVAGAQPAISGEILVRNRPVKIRRLSDGIRHGIVYVPEERRSQGLVLGYSIEHNITLSRLAALSRYGYLAPAAERSLANRFAGELTIRGANLDAPVSRLSGGNQQKVVVAKSLATKPQILLLDEPTRGIDVGAKAEIYRLMDDLVADGKAILFISSELQEVLAIADRMIVMAGGRVVADMPASEATPQGCLAAAMRLTSEAGTETAAEPAAEPGLGRTHPETAKYRSPVWGAVTRLLHRPEGPSVLFLALLLAVLSVITHGFFSLSNFESLLVQVAIVGIIALALNQVLLCGEIDISMGAVLAVCIYVTAWVANGVVGDLWLPLLASVVAGCVLGAINGVLVVGLAIPSIVATLGTMTILSGLIFSTNETITSIPAATAVLGRGLNYFAPGLILIGMLAVFGLVANGTQWGWNVRALGDNATAAMLTGIRAKRTRFLAFVGVGAATGLAAVIYLGQLGTAEPSVASSGIELEIIAAAVIGGTSPMGGRGSTLSPFIGALLLGVLNSGLALLAVPGTLQDVVYGAVILIAISMELVRRKVLEAGR